MTMRHPSITEGAFRTLRAAGFGGMCKLAVGTTPQAFEFKRILNAVNDPAWQGEMVDVQVIGGPAYYIFSETSTDTPDITTERLTSTLANGDPDIAKYLPEGNWPIPIPESDKGSVYLIIRAVSGTIDVRVHRS